MPRRGPAESASMFTPRLFQITRLARCPKWSHAGRLNRVNGVVTDDTTEPWPARPSKPFAPGRRPRFSNRSIRLLSVLRPVVAHSGHTAHRGESYATQQ